MRVDCHDSAVEGDGYEWGSLMSASVRYPPQGMELFEYLVLYDIEIDLPLASQN